MEARTLVGSSGRPTAFFGFSRKFLTTPFSPSMTPSAEASSIG
jgi:hypothetical protein